MDKKTIVILFGGQSSEHEVSCVSAAHVIRSVNPDKYDLLLIGITKEGRWLLADSVDALEADTWRESEVSAVLSPDASRGEVLLLRGEKVQRRKVDVIFPVLHGLYGEDGTVQGLCELAQIPYVGCGVLSSAVSMDKLTTKILVESLQIAQARSVRVYRWELARISETVGRVEASLSYPVFVKPSNAGSSRGISKAKNREELEQALKRAAKEDSRILVEETIAGRELETAVLQDADGVKVSGIGEILTSSEFYDYEAKYHSSESRTLTDPPLPEGKREEIRRDARAIFAAVNGRGLARVDFFLEEETNRVIFNEINTLPGFTSISMYSKLWEAQGISQEQLVDRLIASAWRRG